MFEGHSPEFMEAYAEYVKDNVRAFEAYLIFDYIRHQEEAINAQNQPHLAYEG